MKNENYIYEWGENMKKRIKYIFCIVFALSAIVNISAQGHLSWYTMRNKEHKQPCLGNDFLYIKNYDCYYVDEKNKDEKIIYLTFDAGYENGNIRSILDTLKKHEVTGAFFILENLIKREPELVKRMNEEGHLVCNHTANHKDMSQCTDIAQFKNELQLLEKAYTELTGDELAKFYRPPEGRLTEQNLEFAEELGYTTVLWSFAYADWDNSRQPEYSDAIKKIMENTHNGEIMLLHPTSATNAEIMDELLTRLKNEGYRFASLEELCK